MNIVLLHALPLDERMWEPQREALDGHDVVTPNLYALGSTIDEWADAVLARTEGAFVAVGASMGGYCALAIARRAPERLAGIVLAGSRAGADSPEQRAGRDETVRTIEERGAAGLWETLEPKLFGPAAPAEVIEKARALAVDQDPADLVRAVRAIRDRADTSEAAFTFARPLLVVAGADDGLIPLEQARAVADAAPAGRLVVIDDAGHLPSLEHPDEFNRLLAEFLDDV